MMVMRTRLVDCADAGPEKALRPYREWCPGGAEVTRPKYGSQCPQCKHHSMAKSSEPEKRKLKSAELPKDQSCGQI